VSADSAMQTACHLSVAPDVEVQSVLLLAGDYSLFEMRSLWVTEGLDIYTHPQTHTQTHTHLHYYKTCNDIAHRD
jgi:hypothetical protein